MRAIDVHCHMSTEKGWPMTEQEKLAMQAYYKSKSFTKTENEMAQDFVDQDVKAVLISANATSITSISENNDYAAKLVRDYPQAFLGAWARVEPLTGKLGVRELERAITRLGLMGLKFQPCTQGFFPNDPLVYPLYEKCTELKVPVMFHTGTTGAGAGTPGGGGYHLKYAQPIPYLDDVAADFPNLTIVAAHPSWPWQEEMIAIANHKANVYMELSGWAPKYFPDSLKREVNGRLQDKVMFGSDYPLLSQKRWLDEFENGGYKPEVIEKVFYKNAQKILHIGL